MLVHPRDLGRQQVDRRERGRVVGLIEPRVVEGDLEVQERRRPAVRCRQALDALDGGGRAQREPQPTVGGEGLLGREVVAVELRGIDEQPARARRRVDDHEARGVFGRAMGIMTPVEVSLWVSA